MDEVSPRDNALVAFLQALALTVDGIETLAPEDRRKENVLRVFDGYLWEIVKDEAPAVQEGCRELRQGLSVAFDQLRLYRQGDSP